jgi:hypothetical protein
MLGNISSVMISKMIEECTVAPNFVELKKPGLSASALFRAFSMKEMQVLQKETGQLKW